MVHIVVELRVFPSRVKICDVDKNKMIITTVLINPREALFLYGGKGEIKKKNKKDHTTTFEIVAGKFRTFSRVQ